MKTKGKEKGKAIIGIAMAAIMIASVMAAMVTPAAAWVRDPRAVVPAGPGLDGTWNTPDDPLVPTVVIGELVTLPAGVTQIQYATWDGNSLQYVGTGQILSVTALGVDTADVTTAGKYIDSAGNVLSLTDSKFDVTLRLGTPPGGPEVSSVVTGQRIDVVVDTNVPGALGTIPPFPPAGGPNDYKLVVTEKDKPDVPIITGVGRPGFGAPAGTVWSIATGAGGLGPGEYELKSVTYVTGPAQAAIDIKSTTKSLTVLTQAIEVEADLSEQTTGNEVVLTVTSGVNRAVVVTAVGAAGSFVTGKGNVAVGEVFGVAGNQRYIDTIPADGTLTAVITSTTTGAVTIRAGIDTNVNGRIDPGEAIDSLDVTFKKPRTTVEVPTNKFTIGDKVTIRGTTDSGVDQVAIFINDRLRDLRSVEADNTYEWEWDTGLTATPKPGSVTIKVFEVHTIATAASNDFTGPLFIGGGLDTGCGGTGVPAPLSVFYDTTLGIPTRRPADTSTGLLAIAGELTATMDTPRVAKEDDIIVTGTAAGETVVRVILIDKDGVPIADTTASVLEDDTFEYTRPTTAAMKSGTYKIAIISDGRDDSTLLTGGCDISGGNCPVGAPVGGIGPLPTLLLTNALATIDGTLVIDMTQSQLIARIENLVLESGGAAGSDDKMDVLSFKLEDPLVEITEVEGEMITIDQVEVSAAVTDGALSISGICNRVAGTELLITASNVVDIKNDLTPQTVVVANGTFFVELDVTDAVEGKYAVKVDDLSKATDELDVMLTLEAAPTPTPTPTPTATATATPTIPPTTPTPTPTEEVPGFEAVFAITGMLSIAYLVLRRRK